MTLRFGVFDHIEPVPGQRLDQIEFFTTEVMPRYATRSTSAFADTRTGPTSSTRRPS